MTGHKLPDQQRKNEESHTPHGGAGGSRAHCPASAHRAAQTFLLFSFLLVLFDQGCARRENCGKSQQKAAYRRAGSTGDNSGSSGDTSTEYESDCVLVPFRLSQSGSIELDAHYGLSPRLFSPKATANHRGIAPSVTQRALTGYRIITQLTREA